MTMDDFITTVLEHHVSMGLAAPVVWILSNEDYASLEADFASRIGVSAPNTGRTIIIESPFGTITVVAERDTTHYVARPDHGKPN